MALLHCNAPTMNADNAHASAMRMQCAMPLRKWTWVRCEVLVQHSFSYYIHINDIVILLWITLGRSTLDI